MSRLIINADDFGLTAGVNHAIIEVHQAGGLTSATLMARASATSEAIALAQTAPSLGIGCHIVLVDGEPVLPQSRIESLLDPRTGNFQPDLGKFLMRLFAGRVRPDHIEAEAAAQIDFLQSNGVKLTHIDTHKHTHIFPAVLRPILRAAKAAGIRTVRNPFEPEWSVRATPNASWMRRAQVDLLRRWKPSFLRLVAQEGFATTDGALGVLATGTLDEQAIRSILSGLPEGTWELVTHPGCNDDDLMRVRTRLRASREIERRALLKIGRHPETTRISFAELQCEP